MAYTFDRIIAEDPVTGENAAPGSTVLIFDPADTTLTPLSLTKPTGEALPNPVEVNGRSQIPDFVHASLDRVAWEGGTASGFITAHESIKNEALSARDAAVAAAADASSVVDRANAGEFTGATGPAGPEGPQGLPGTNAVPSDTAVAGYINTTGTSETKTALRDLLDKTGVRVFGTGVAATDTPALQVAMDSAASKGVPLVPRGSFTVNATLQVPSGLTMLGDLATFTQTAALTELFELNAKTGVNLRNVKAVGLTTDYTNSSAVYQAAAVKIMGASSRIDITGCEFLGFAGAGVYLDVTATDVRVARCRFTGPGSTYITSTTYNFGGGLVAMTGAKRWAATDNEISGFTQGIVTGDNMTDVRITGNYIHDIPGQHGLYLETMNGGVVANNLVRNAALCGMKIQVGTTTVNDADGITITGNVFLGVGAQGILLTNPPGGAPRLRNITVTGNVIRDGAGTAIEANNCVGLHVADNVVHNAATGLNVAVSSRVQVVDNHFSQMGHHGIRIDATDVQVIFNRIIDPASANNASTEFGIQVLGTSADVSVRGNKVTDSLGNMRYGIYVSAGDQASMDFTDNRSSGATDYGWRGMATAARTFRGNSFAGTLGAMLTPPTNFTTIAAPASDTSGTKAAIDAIRSVLTANGLTQ